MTASRVPMALSMDSYVGTPVSVTPGCNKSMRGKAANATVIDHGGAIISTLKKAAAYSVSIPLQLRTAGPKLITATVI